MGKSIATLSDVMHPMGIGASAISTKYQTQAFAQLYFSYIGLHIKSPLVVRNKDEYIILVRVPSEKNKKAVKPVFYDVLYQFYPKDAKDKVDLSIADYGVRIFSNSPSYVYTFAYVYYKRGLIPTFLHEKFLSKEAITTAPKVRNPGSQLLGLEKTIWMATYFLQRNRYLNKNILDTIALQQNIKIEDITSLILSQESKQNERMSMIIKRKFKKVDNSKKPKNMVEKADSDNLKDNLKTDSLRQNIKNGLSNSPDMKSAYEARNTLKNTSLSSMKNKDNSLKMKGMGNKKSK